MDIDLKTLAPDNTIPAGAVLFGADSQAAAEPSVYRLSDVVAVATAATASAANTFSADQVISKPTPVLVLNKTASGQFLSLRGSTNGSLRWEMPLGNGTAESGSNAGSDFEIASYTDAGTGRAVRMRIRRSDGFTTIGGSAEIGTPDASNSLLLRRRGAASGGRIDIERGGSGNTLASDVRIALEGNLLQIGETGGTQRGCSIDITALAAAFGTPLGGGNITLVAPQATTGGTQFDFTGLPAGINEIVVHFNGVSVTGPDRLLVQLGTSSGVETASYVSTCIAVNTASLANAIAHSTAGFAIPTHSGNVWAFNGQMFIRRMSGNTWNASFGGAGTTISGPADFSAYYGGGIKTLAGTLDRVRLTRTGTDTFDAGAVSISYR
jgi:hypothetical protein